MSLEKFFQEAGNRICSSLEIDKALRSLFDYLITYIPILHIALVLGDNSEDKLKLHVVARVSADEAILHNNANIDNYLYHNIDVVHGIVTVVEENVNELQGVYISNDSSFILDVPLVTLSLQTEGRQRGGMFFRFKKGTKLTDEYVQMIRGLHAPALIAFANCLHFMELTRLREKLMLENQELQDKLELFSARNLIGSSKAIKFLLVQIQSIAPLHTNVLITGESGTGKEITARAIHSMSHRVDKPFIAINCGAIPENLIESELFGYEKGAFTSSHKSHKGKFERAEGGTIFLDEIAELSLTAQVKLLRVVQELEIERIGGEKTIPIDVRIIAATNQNLEKMVQEKKFREDLYYRLSVFMIKVPPLRERKEDIPYLVNHFIKLKAAQLKLNKLPIISNASLELLCQMPWQGNVRELENYIERQLIMTNIENSSFLAMPSEEIVQADELHLSVDELMEKYLRVLFLQTNGKISGVNSVCSISGLSRDTIYRYKRKFNF